MDGTHSVTLTPSHVAPQSNRRYVRLFDPPAAGTEAHSDSALEALAAKMVIRPQVPEDAAEDSSLPAGYTYFAQFVAHDLTFEPSSSHQRELDPDFLEDYRTPRFDLDGVYGRGPEEQPFFFLEDGERFLLGHRFVDSLATDVPRTSERSALIADPRNDQNAIVCQLHALFLRLHNRLVDTGLSFEAAQRSVRAHYQYVVLNDLLPRLVGSTLLESMVDLGSSRLKGLSLYAPATKDPGVAIEFAAAGGRFGHSMVRPAYRLNRTLAFSTMSPDPFGSLVAFAKPMAPSWGIEWDLFVDPPVPPLRTHPNDTLQKAYKIDACLSEPLTRLPSVIVNLAERNLKRGRALNLPSGQAVARALGIQPLADSDILIGDVSRGKEVAITDIQLTFANNCPLWPYVLAEASAARKSDAEKGAVAGAYPRQLGEVGGRIVAETFLTLLAADKTSILNEPFQLTLRDGNKPFDLGALIAAALG